MIIHHRETASSEAGTVNDTKRDDFSRCVKAVGTRQDVEAFEALFRFFGPRIRAFMIKRGSDRQSAEELMQETMMTIWKRADQFDPIRGNVSSWIFTIARNAHIDAYRKTGRPQFDPHDPAFVPDEDLPADQKIEADDDALRLRKAMAKLPAEQIELLELSFFEDISHSSIAEKLNLPLGTVKSRIRLAFSRLRDALGEKS